MKNKLIIIFCILLCLFTSIGCAKENNEITDLQIMASYSIPVTFRFDLKGPSGIKVLEEDSYGRILFSYSFYNYVSKQNDSAILICQKFDEQHVYFYEDICYLIGTCSQNDLEILKETNDWDSSYDESKMSRRKTKYTLDSFIITETKQDISRIERKFANELKINISSISERFFVDEDYNGLAMYFFTVNCQDSEKSYIVISNNLYNLTFAEISSSENYNDSVIALKKDSNWKYKY